MVCNDPLQAAASCRDLIGTPWVEGGTDPRAVDVGGHGGIDCYGFSLIALERMGLGGLLPIEAAAALVPSAPLGRELAPGEAPVAGDVLYRPSDASTRHHIGVCCNADTFIHAVRHERESGVVVDVRAERLFSWRAIGAKVYRLVGRSDAR